MATVTKGKTFGTTEEVTAAKLHQLVDSATVTGIVNADIGAAADIAGSKLASDALAAAYPVGSIYMNATDATDPATLLGFGTWVAFGAGKVPVGIDSGDTDFDTAEETGGAKTHTLSEGELPSHTHSVQMQAQVNRGSGSGSPNNNVARNDSGGFSASPINTGTTGSGSAHNNLQPYIVVYMWKRTV